MKILIVYYSKTNNTKRVAQELAGRLGADLEALVDKKERSGAINYLLSGHDSLRKLETSIEEPTKNPAEYDLVIVGSPVWAWNISPAVRTYLKKEKQKIKKFAFFTTSGSTEVEKILKYVGEIMDAEPLAHVGFDAKELAEQEAFEQKISGFVSSVKKLGNGEGV